MSDPEFFMGIDPGKQGGIAVIWYDDEEEKEIPGINLYPMPKTEEELFEVFETVDTSNGIATLEKVWAMRGEGVTSSFTFGRGYGSLLAFLISARIPFDNPSPKAWQKHYSLPKDDKKQHKLNLLEKAKLLFPQEPLWNTPRTLGKQKAVCDALLIANYCKDKYEGKVDV